MNLEQLILLNIDLVYFENKYESETVPIKKYWYWESLQKIRKIVSDENEK